MDYFVNITICPFQEELTNEINKAFNIAGQLKEFTLINLASIPIHFTDLENFKLERKRLLTNFCGQVLSSLTPVVGKDALYPH